MKKNLIVALALVFVLGIAGTAFAAANPFVDVPAKHWAYDAVSNWPKPESLTDTVTAPIVANVWPAVMKWLKLPPKPWLALIKPMPR